MPQIDALVNHKEQKSTKKSRHNNGGGANKKITF
jgi:hypothetical protein